jgi:anaerobic magnesium-protoporphyrin IX monomethyl ester cyclase
MLTKKDEFNKSNKVLFIIHDVYQDFNQFPLGEGYLAAILHDSGASVEAYCMDVFHYSNEQLAEHLQNNEYDLIGVGFMAARFNETVVELCKVINNNKKNAWLVLGGHGPSPIPEYVLRKTNADLIATGEFEKHIVDLLRCKVKGLDISEVMNIAYLKDNQLKINEISLPVSNLNEIPFPLWEIFPMEKYTTCLKMFNQKEHEKSFVFLSSRGCVNKCNFCYRMEKGIRVRSIKNIIDELKVLVEQYGVNCFFFQDELFVLSKNRLLEFEEALKEENLTIKFSCNARVDIMDQEIVEILKRCGCQFINFGFESSSDTVLKLMNKNASLEQNMAALKLVKDIGGIGMGLNFIWNNLGDNEDTLRKNVELIKKYNTYYQCRTIRPVTPYPGSDLYYHLIKEGKIKGPADFFERFINSDLILINLMDISDEKAYELLLEVNTDLILDHYNNTAGDLDEAQRLIQQFADLYSRKIINFRGSRHYNNDDKDNPKK